MDRLNEIRSEAGSSRDLTLDTSSPPSESYMTANESSSKYFSLSEVDSTFEISPSKDTSNAESDGTLTTDSDLISNLSPIPKKNDLDSYNIGKQIEAANILSGGVNIFDDNENSYDGDELVIDDNVAVDEEKNSEKLNESTALSLEKTVESLESLDESEAIPSKDTEVVLQIDGKNVNAIDIGNGLYLYRKAGQEELAAVQIVDDDQQQPSFKFLKVRENAEGNLEVYEEIEIEVPKEVPIKEGKLVEKTSHVPIKEINKVISEPSINKVTEKVNVTPKNDLSIAKEPGSEPTIDLLTESKSEVNLNGKMMKFNESRKSPVIGTFTPMTFHSTPNKEGIPLTKTMVDQQLHPSRHSDNIKKTIEVHTDISRQKLSETPTKSKDNNTNEIIKTDEQSGLAGNEVEKELETDSKQLLMVSEAYITEDNKEADTFAKTEINCKESVAVKEQTIDQEEPKHDQDQKLEISQTEKYVENISTKDENTSISIQDAQTNELSPNLVSEKHKEDTDLHTKVEEINSVKDIVTEKVLKIDSTLSDEKMIVTDVEMPNTGDSKETTSIKESDKNSQPKEVIEISDEETKQGEDTSLRSSVDESNLVIDDEVITNTTESKVENEKLEENATETSSKIVERNNERLEEKLCVLTKVNETNEVVCDKKLITIIPPHTEKHEIETIEIKDITSDNICTVVLPNEDHRGITSHKYIEINNDKHDAKNVQKTNDHEKLKVNSEPPVDDNKFDSEDVHNSELNDVKQIMKENDIALEIVSTTNLSEEKNVIVPAQEPMNKEKPKVNIVSKLTFKDTKIPHVISNNKQNIHTKPQSDTKKIDAKIELPKKCALPKPNNNNNSAVPFGKWTEANRQEFLNKIKEAKVPSTTNAQQLKQPNDLNRRDILKKIDSQRQTSIVNAKSADYGAISKLNIKKETTVFVNKTQPAQSNIQETKVVTAKIQQPLTKLKPLMPKKLQKDDSANPIPATKKSVQRKEINNQELIDKTIEGIINRAMSGKSSDTASEKSSFEKQKDTKLTMDDIEMKMNELHGISNEERMTHANPQSIANDNTKYSKQEVKVNKSTKIPNLLPFKNKDQPNVKENVAEEPSDEEIIEHEPITGDIDVNKQSLMSLLSSNDKVQEIRKEAIITEKDFDKFARRNSITYENCLTVNFDGKEPHNVIQTVVEKDPPIKKLSRNELMLAESKAKSTNKQQIAMRHSNQLSKIPTNVKTGSDEEAFSKNYQSKVQIAYQTALTAKKHLECPIPIIEDKPVKVVYNMDSDMEFTPGQLNVQGQELSPTKKLTTESDIVVNSASESLDSDIVESNYEVKTDEAKSKSKHQRKQVLTPVEEPEIELIEPSDLGIEVSPKKKRKLEDKGEKISKSLVPKKTYLLNRNIIDEQVSKSQESIKNSVKETENVTNTFSNHTGAISALDNLVKAAELIENQSEHNNTLSSVRSTDSPQTTPVKRGRGRPRKYPLPEPGLDVSKIPSPQKKPRLIDAKPPKSYTDSDESSDGEIIKENWTMGKINENIVCPICSKLFRSENVVFKHVKHCTGPSPNRSESDKRSPRRYRRGDSRDSDRKSLDSESDYTDDEEEKIRRRKSNYKISKSINDNDDVIVIEDTPVKEKAEKLHKSKNPETKIPESKKTVTKAKILHKTNNLICEFCGKTFRQLSYLVNHKLQHKREVRNSESEEQISSRSVFSCEVCKKEFRKLHHLVQHRNIHNPTSMSSRILRKSSSEQHDNKISKNPSIDSKPTDDASAGFRCEPCDKSFRKLHHLVEHRETHDGINKKGSNPQSSNETSNKPAIAYHCDKCKKIFKKLQDYLEHKDQHLETSSEKSDDKSVKSSLSTKDIIHECSLCYMVFPNEHSLNKHTVICLRKKKQSAAKQAAKQTEGQETMDTDELVVSENISQEDESSKENESVEHKEGTPNDIEQECEILELNNKDEEMPEIPLQEDINDKNKLERKNSCKERKSSDKEIIPEKRSSAEPEKSIAAETVTPEIDESETPIKIKKLDVNDVITITDSPILKKKTPVKDKIATTGTKRHKTVNVSLPVVDETTPMESTDEDEIRYMLNPNFKENESTERKLFMKVNAKKRSSLQIERPNSKDLVKRRISLQHPPKIPRLKVKAVEARPINSLAVEKKLKMSVVKPPSSTDSDDSDVKYSFPKTSKEDTQNVEKKVKKSLAAKRKSLGGIAKRKSLGKHKMATPTNKTKKRTTEIEHRCDCGQLFSSAALLSRHTTLAHTPPRIRRRRSPPPPPTRQIEPRTKSKTNVQSKKLKSDLPSNKTPTRKSSANSSEKKTSDVVQIEFVGKKLRSSAHRGVPVPDKMKKMMDKLKK
ncbi:unnamed protein product, partial [Brenthis ino]